MDYVIVPGHGKVRVGDTISTVVPGKGRVNTTVTGGYSSSYERTRARVYATGNKWAIENFEATHN